MLTIGMHKIASITLTNNREYKHAGSKDSFFSRTLIITFDDAKTQRIEMFSDDADSIEIKDEIKYEMKEAE